MNPRAAVIAVYVIAFFVALYSLSWISGPAWSLVPIEQKAVAGFQVVAAAAGVLIAYSLYMDGEEIDNLNWRLAQAEATLHKIKEKEQKTAKIASP